METIRAIDEAADVTTTEAPGVAAIWRQPMPWLADNPATRITCRLFLTAFRGRIPRVIGAEHVQTRHDAFILALNHSTRFEAVMVPAALTYLREGRLIHFFSDWNFQLWPVAGQIIRLSEPITVTRKPARPRVFNFLRPLFIGPRPALEQGRRLIEDGKSVGVFPEGTVNKNPRDLLRGDRGAAWLSLATGAPVVAGGIRFAGGRMEVEFAPPLRPPRGGSTGLSEVRDWHARIMEEVSRLCGKNWNRQLVRRKHAHH